MVGAKHSGKSSLGQNQKFYTVMLRPNPEIVVYSLENRDKQTYLQRLSDY